MGALRAWVWSGGADPMSLPISANACYVPVYFRQRTGLLFMFWHPLYLLRGRIQFLPLPLPNLETSVLSQSMEPLPRAINRAKYCPPSFPASTVQQIRQHTVVFRSN
jgi:hypothetical protein